MWMIAVVAVVVAVVVVHLLPSGTGTGVGTGAGVVLLSPPHLLGVSALLTPTVAATITEAVLPLPLAAVLAAAAAAVAVAVVVVAVRRSCVRMSVSVTSTIGGASSDAKMYATLILSTGYQPPQSATSHPALFCSRSCLLLLPLLRLLLRLPLLYLLLISMCCYLACFFLLRRTTLRTVGPVVVTAASAHPTAELMIVTVTTHAATHHKALLETETPCLRLRSGNAARREPCLRTPPTAAAITVRRRR
jgi:hypothetical protein